MKQRGSSFFGALILLLILGAGAYFGYQWYQERGNAPTCKDDLTACMRMCRRLSTESADIQKCQAACERDATACERKIGER
jgi:predicted negative regulator of RcsB-dependent stress response